jgi:hypothetical protein
MSRLSRSEPVSRQHMEMDMTDAPSPRKPVAQGLRSGLFLLDPEPESKPRERRRMEYPRHAIPRRRWDRIDSAVVSVLMLLALVVVAPLLLLGCVTTELTSAGVTISRTSVLSDVELEASIGPKGEMSIRERQGQAVAEGLAGALPRIAP